MNLSELAYFVDDVRETADFYETLLGVAPVHRDESLAIFRAGDTTILIHRTCEPGEGDPPCENHVAFSVDDLESAVEDLQRKGIRVEVPPRTYYWGRSAYLRDPDGRLIELSQEMRDSA